MQELPDVCAKLRRWPRRILEDDRELAAICLAQCCDLFEAHRAVFLIDNGDEPWLNIAVSDRGQFTWTEDENLSLDSLSDGESHDCPFFIDASATIDSRLRALVGEGTVLSVAVIAESLSGQLFIREPKLSRDVAIAAMDAVATILAVQFEASWQLRNTVREAVDQERIRVARDLHDGLLQSFTGVVLQLETVHSMLITDPQSAQRMITQTQGMIMSDQRELRRFVEELRPLRRRRPAAKFDFTERLEDMRSRFEHQWGIRVAVDVVNVDPTVAGFLGQETFRLISEAVMNSAKHGRASDVHVGVRTAGSEMQIEVSDNGTGFPFHGRLTLEEMRESGSGPTMLAERVSSLNGNLTVDSTESGSTVTMTVPLGFGA